MGIEITCSASQKFESRTAASICMVSPSALNFSAIKRKTNPQTLATTLPSHLLLTSSMMTPKTTLIKLTKTNVSKRFVTGGRGIIINLKTKAQQWKTSPARIIPKLSGRAKTLGKKNDNKKTKKARPYNNLAHRKKPALL